MPGSHKHPGQAPAPPKAFQVRRDVPLGRHPLLQVFPGLDRLEAAARQEPDATGRDRLYGTTFVEIVDADLWMYVAPFTRPALARRGRWQPVVAPGVDCIVIGESHLRESPAITLFMDIFHELCHIQQRRGGEELFDRPENYVRRPTELAAYRFAVAEARRLGADDAFLRDYLEVEWVPEEEHLELLDSMGVARP
jgi:hypothetical protein